MSFSADVKEELVNIIPHDRHCRIAELTALLAFAGKREGNAIRVYPTTETQAGIRKCFTLLNKTFNINTDVFKKDIEKNKTYIEFNRESPGMDKVLDAIATEAPMYLLTNDCCKRAYLRGAFISAGFINDPNKAYHLEFVCSDEVTAEMLMELMEDFNANTKMVLRKKYYVVYVKDSDTIQDILNVLEAHKAMMELVNTRIVKDFRNDTNRRVNCDVANAAKALSTGLKQIEDITLIQNTIGLNSLPLQLKEIAEVRLNNPDSTLGELGELLDPPVSKSGVNHRLRKISEQAQRIRMQGESGNDKERNNN